MLREVSEEESKYAVDEEIQGSLNQDAAACLGEFSQSPQGHCIMQTTSE